jgi:hypothetical protein
MDFWPDKYQGGISLTFDDGMRSQLEFAIPELNRRGFKATFYLNPRGNDNDSAEDSWQSLLAKWIPAQAIGHEIGNHTLSHPCSLNIHAAWLEGKNIQDWSLDQMEADIVIAQTRIDSVFPGQKSTSFAYPCYETTVGRGLKRQSYTPIVAKYFVAARAKGELQGHLANDPQYCDLHHLSSWPVERQPGAFMIGMVEETLAVGGWGIFTFHGIQEGHLPVGDQDFLTLLNHLQRRKEAVWTAPVATIASFIHARFYGVDKVPGK